MTKIWAFDPSKHTGFAEWHSKTDISSIVCNVIEMPAECDHYWFPVQFQRKLLRLVKDRGKPDLVVMEQQSLASMGNNLDGVIFPWVAVGTICGVFGAYGVPLTRIAPATWRKMFFGTGFKPPQKAVNKKANGKTTVTYQNDWKAAAVSACERHGIVIPPKKTTNHNACEAAAMAICWRGAEPINKEMHSQFIALVQQRNERAA